jgi:hypothetical protein
VPKAFVGSDGELWKACPQCIQDELGINPNLSHEEAAERATVRADTHFCRSRSTADGYQPWCKMHIAESNRARRRSLDPQELEDRKRRQRENASRGQKELLQEQKRVRRELGLESDS